MAWRTCASIGFIVLGAATLLMWRVDPILIHNGSPSVPTGFYVRSGRAPRLGDFVTVRAVRVAPDYARARGFADPTDRFIKRIAAAGGDTVCAHDDTVTIGSTTTMTRALRDSAGRPLPRWSGCRTLADDEFFLLGDTPDSFDSRYWGPTPKAAVDGVWTRLDQTGYGPRSREVQSVRREHH